MRVERDDVIDVWTKLQFVLMFLDEGVHEAHLPIGMIGPCEIKLIA